MRLNYRIPDELHREAKAVAALRGVTLREFVIGALAKAVREQAGHDKQGGDDR